MNMCLIDRIKKISLDTVIIFLSGVLSLIALICYIATATTSRYEPNVVIIMHLALITLYSVVSLMDMNSKINMCVFGLLAATSFMSYRILFIFYLVTFVSCCIKRNLNTIIVFLGIIGIVVHFYPDIFSGMGMHMYYFLMGNSLEYLIHVNIIFVIGLVLKHYKNALYKTNEVHMG